MCPSLIFKARPAAPRAPQVVTISGESGAGKTESAKLFIKMIVNCARGSEFQGLEDKLLKMNPILESFGNAKTAMVCCDPRRFRCHHCFGHFLHIVHFAAAANHTLAATLRRMAAAALG